MYIIVRYNNLLLFCGSCYCYINYIYIYIYISILCNYLEPPDPVQNLRTVSTTANSVTVTWDKPASTGGRSDYYYFVGRSDPQGSATSVVPVNSTLMDLGNTITFPIGNLLPFQRYVFTVIVHNGVSSQDSVNVGSRTRTTEGQTTESRKFYIYFLNFQTK